MVAIEVPVLSI